MGLSGCIDMGLSELGPAMSEVSPLLWGGGITTPTCLLCALGPALTWARCAVSSCCLFPAPATGQLPCWLPAALQRGGAPCANPRESWAGAQLLLGLQLEFKLLLLTYKAPICPPLAFEGLSLSLGQTATVFYEGSWVTGLSL